VVGKSVADSLDLLGIEGAEAWSDGVIMRYRSRRTLIDIIGQPEFYARHDFKLAGLEKTIAYPIRATDLFGRPASITRALHAGDHRTP
jgi:hypothetical protein